MSRFLKTIWLIVADLLFVNIAYILAFVLKFEFDVESPQFDAWFVVYVDNILPITLFGIALPAIMSSYSTLWQYAVRQDFVKLIIGIWLGMIVTAEYMTVTKQMMPSSIYCIAALIMTLLMLTLRLGMNRKTGRRESPAFAKNASGGKEASKVIVVGADDTGASIIKAFKTNPEYNKKVVSIIDEDLSKLGKKINGVRVSGGSDKMAAVAADLGADEIMIGDAYVKKQGLAKITEECAKTDCKVTLLPSLGELLKSKNGLYEIRDEDIENLLKDHTPKLSEEQEKDCLTGKIIMVTGAGKSIGSALCRRIARCRPRRLIALDTCAESLAWLAEEISDINPKLEFETMICSADDKNTIAQMVAGYAPHIIFHAASWNDAVLRTSLQNTAERDIDGAKIVMELADEYAAERFVLILNDDEAYGNAAKTAEEVMQVKSLSAKNTKYTAVCVGKILSADSMMIKKFQRQIAVSGTIKLDCADSADSYITTSQAASGIIEACAKDMELETNGETVSLDIGEPISTKDIAEAVIRLSGYVPGIEANIITE